MKKRPDVLAGLIKIDISDHFPTFIVSKNNNTTNFSNRIAKYIMVANNKSITRFRHVAQKNDWLQVTDIKSINEDYNIFLKQFLIIY